MSRRISLLGPTDRPKILVLEDEDTDFNLLLAALGPARRRVTQVTSLRALAHIAALEKFDVILCDLNVDDSHGLDTFEHVNLVCPDTAIVVLSDYPDDGMAMAAIKRGAQDFIRKSTLGVENIALKIKFAIERNHLRCELEKAQMISKKQSEFKSDFLAHFSHEIRTPLNAVIGTTCLMEETKLDEDQRHLLANLKIGSERLLAIINDILDLSKIEAGKLAIVTSSFNVRDMVGEIVALFESVSVKKGIFLGTYIDPKVPTTIEADASRIRQILTNLFSNAAKFTDTGHIVTSVTMDQNDRIRFSVRDSGKGISDQGLANLFTPFNQDHQDDMQQGTGLGLSLCKELVELLGGSIGVERNEAHGLTFWFEIVPENLGHVHNQRTDLDDRQVVLVSRNDELIGLVSKQLKSRGLNILAVKSSLEAQPAHENPDVIYLVDNMGQSSEGPGDDQPLAPVIPLFGQADGPTDKILNFGLHHSDLLQMLATACGEIAREMTRHDNADQDLTFLSGAKFLVVDDDPVNRILMTRMLEHLDIMVTTAKNGREAVECLKGSVFDCIMMDCMMPVMSGYKASRQIRKLGIETPIVALTANAFESDRRKCQDAGMELFLAKPVRTSDLMLVMIKLKTLLKAA